MSCFVQSLQERTTQGCRYIGVGLEHREDEFSFVKLASLQERATQGCRFTKKNAMGETKNKLC